MTLEEFEKCVLQLANGKWCRFWVKIHAQGTLMSLQTIDKNGKPCRVVDAEQWGFHMRDDFVYTILRTDKDGHAYWKNS
jgi:hypothetical protein